MCTQILPIFWGVGGHPDFVNRQIFIIGVPSIGKLASFPTIALIIQGECSHFEDDNKKFLIPPHPVMVFEWSLHNSQCPPPYSGQWQYTTCKFYCLTYSALLRYTYRWDKKVWIVHDWLYLIPDAVRGRYCTIRYPWNIMPVRNYFLFLVDLPCADLFSIVSMLLCSC